MRSAALTAAPTASSRLPWVHNDWAAAEKAAAASGKLVAVDVWATWCHTCLSMKNFVLEEKPLEAVAGQHVWLSLDYDQEKNAEFFPDLPGVVLPHLLWWWNPKAKQVVARWVGSGTAEEMAGFFKGAKRESEDALSRGGRALARGDHLAARGNLETALAKKPLDRGEETKLLGGLIEALWKLDPKACVERGLTPSSAARTPRARLGRRRAGDRLRAERARGEEEEGGAAQDPRSPREDNQLARDGRPGDRQSVGDLLYVGRCARWARRGRPRRCRHREAAGGARGRGDQDLDPKDRATFDAHRVECYLRLKRYEVPEKMLLASEKDFPKDFNPPARLALIYRAKKDYAAAEKAVDRALALGYGPRKMRLHSTKIDILIDAGKLAEAKKAIAAARADIAKMDAALVKPSWGAALDAQEKKARGTNAR